MSSVANWVLDLYVETRPPSPSPPPASPGAGASRSVARSRSGATLAGRSHRRGGAVAGAAGPDAARLVWDVTVFTGLDALTPPLLQQLARTRRPSSIVVIEPDGSRLLLAGARSATGHGAWSLTRRHRGYSCRCWLAGAAAPCATFTPMWPGRGQRGRPDHGQRDPESGTSLTWNSSRTFITR